MTRVFDLAHVAQFHAEPIGEKRSRMLEGYLV
jgi:hypothetical protein